MLILYLPIFRIHTIWGRICLENVIMAGGALKHQFSSIPSSLRFYFVVCLECVWVWVGDKKLSRPKSHERARALDIHTETGKPEAHMSTRHFKLGLHMHAHID